MKKNGLINENNMNFLFLWNPTFIFNEDILTLYYTVNNIVFPSFNSNNLRGIVVEDFLIELKVDVKSILQKINLNKTFEAGKLCSTRKLPLPGKH